MYLLNNVKTETAWELHKCASDAFLRSLGKQMGSMEKRSISIAMRACLKDLDWFIGIVGTSRKNMPEQIEGVLEDANTILNAVRELHISRDLPYDLPVAGKKAKRRQPYRKHRSKTVKDDASLLQMKRSKSSLLGETFYTCASVIEEPQICARCTTCRFLCQLWHYRGDQARQKVTWFDQIRVVMISRPPQGC